MGTFKYLFLLPIIFISACGNRLDPNTEHGRQAIIAETNINLSAGNCQGALAAIGPLYESAHADDEVRVLRAAADACFAGFSTIPLLVNIGEKPNLYQALAKSMQNVLGDGRIEALYRATDIITSNGVNLAAFQRSKTLNDFMVFLQLGVMGALEDAYGNGDAEGVKLGTFNYLAAAAGTLSNVNGCAFAAAIGFATDSFHNSNLASSSEAQTAVGRLDAVCASAGVGPCRNLNKDRSGCDGANANSLSADAVVDAVNAAW